MVTLGTGNYTYEVVENWAKLPAGWGFKEVAAVGVDAHDNVYAFNRGAHPMMVFDRHGNFLRSWGEGIFPRAHGITASPDETLFCTDDGDHTVRKCTLDGKVLFTLGMSGKPAPFMSGEPFNRCTHVAIDPRNGDFYVSDDDPVGCISTRRAISPTSANSGWPSVPMPRPTALAHASVSTIPKAMSWHAWATNQKVRPLANSSRRTVSALTPEATSI